MKTPEPSADSVRNLNEVVAQAIRSQNHLQMPPLSLWPELGRRLRERQGTALLKGEARTFEKGLNAWRGTPLDVDIAIVQPGLSLRALRTPSRGRNARILLESVLTLAEQTGGNLEIWCSE